MIKFLVQNGIGACASRKRKQQTGGHLSAAPFECDVPGCNYACTTSGHLTSHKLTHTGEKPFQCDFPGCNYACTQSGNLAAHKRTHTGEKPFQCDFAGCNYACSASGNLTRHKRTHTGEKPFQCDFPGCNYACTQSGSLVTHKRTHTGEKPFQCDFAGCGYATTTSDHLTSHKLTHTGEKPFQCDFAGCGYACSESGNLTVHKRTHTGEKPFQCDFPGCGYATTQSSHVVTHKKAMHTQEGQARQKKQERRVELALEKAGYTPLLAGGVKPPPMHFKREMHVDFKCVGDIDGKFARVDFMLTTASGHLVALEVDEGQHRFGYGSIGCDMKRMTKIYESMVLEGHTQLTFLRYNPDAYKVAGQLQKIRKTAREEWLLAHLMSLPPSSDGLCVDYAYYDSPSASAVRPSICDDLEYDAHLREVVSRVGVE